MAARLTKTKIKKALIDCKGNVTDVAKSLNCTRKTVYNYINKYDDVKEARLDATEAAIDYVENKLFSKIEEGNITAIIFYLKTIGKTRGYIERHEFAGAKDAPLIIEYVNDWRSTPSEN